MVQQHQYTYHLSEDPNENMGRFLRMENTLKLNGVRPEVIKLQLFPFSLRDVETTWSESLSYGSVDNWEDLVEAYMSRFFPPTLTSERRGETIVFKQEEDESLYNAWERYKRLLKRCQMHGIDLTTQMDIFYHSMNYTYKGIIDAAYCGAFKRKSAEEVKQLIEDIAKSNYRAPSETLGSSSRLKGSGVIKLNRMTVKFDALMNKLGNQERIIHPTHEVRIVEESEQKSSAEERLAHEGPYQVEEARFINRNRSYNFKPNLNLPTHYTPALRNHENFSYGGGAQQGLRPMQNFQHSMLHRGSKDSGSKGVRE